MCKDRRLNLDASGQPASNKLLLLERIKLSDDGKQLENVITTPYTVPKAACVSRKDDHTPECN